MNKKILLVEPPVRSTFLPFALQKIATMHLKRNDDVRYVKANPKPPSISKEWYPDKIYISGLFVYHGREICNTINKYKKRYPSSKIKVGGIFPTLMPEFVREQTGLEPHIGQWETINKYTPNYSLFPKKNFAFIRTFDGCIRRCEFCAVKIVEPNFKVVKNWKEQINSIPKEYFKAKKDGGIFKTFNVKIYDNNFLAAPWSHQNEVIDFVSQRHLDIEFGTGLDCRLFKEKHAKLFSKMGTVTMMVFAFDKMEEDGHIQKAIELVGKYKLATDVRIYTLYNFKEKPEELWYRINEILKLSKVHNCYAYPMKYNPLYSVYKNKYIGEHWNQEMLNNFDKIKQTCVARAVVMRGESMQFRIGRTPEEFIEILNKRQFTNSVFSMYRDKKRVRKSGFGIIYKGQTKENIKKVIKLRKEKEKKNDNKSR